MISTSSILLVIVGMLLCSCGLGLGFYLIRRNLGNYPRFSIKKIIYKKKFQRLKEAALKTDLQALQELHASGFNINEDNYIVLEWACRKGNLPIVKLCVELGINDLSEFAHQVIIREFSNISHKKQARDSSMLVINNKVRFYN